MVCWLFSLSKCVGFWPVFCVYWDYYHVNFWIHWYKTLHLLVSFTSYFSSFLTLFIPACTSSPEPCSILKKNLSDKEEIPAPNSIPWALPMRQALNVAPGRQNWQNQSLLSRHWLLNMLWRSADCPLFRNVLEAHDHRLHPNLLKMKMRCHRGQRWTCKRKCEENLYVTDTKESPVNNMLLIRSAFSPHFCVKDG